MRIIKLNEQSRANILADLLKRDPNNYSAYEGTLLPYIMLLMLTVSFNNRIIR